MENLARFGVTVPRDILDEFDRRLAQSGQLNRSDAIRRLMRGYITEERWREEDEQVYGTVTLMYDHHSSSISRELTLLQHEHGGVIVCSTHVHVDGDTCLECIVLKGHASVIKAFLDSINTVKGMKSLDTVITSSI